MAFWKSKSSELTEDSRIIVNVWLPRLNGEITTSACYIAASLEEDTIKKTKIDEKKLNSIGHVSLEMPKAYASWWPDNACTDQVRLFNVLKADPNKSYIEDYESEAKRHADLRICLYGLDVQAIEDCFEYVKKSDYGYVLAGDKITVRFLNKEKGQSCCGLAYELLSAGGALELSAIYKDLKMKYIVVTPDNFCEFLKNAKQVEMSRYPETSSFHQIENEYTPPPRSTCVLV